MANNYIEGSFFIEVGKKNIDKAKEIVDRTRKNIGGDADYCGFESEIIDDGHDCGVWIHHDESIDVDQAEVLVRSLVEGLKLEGVYTCSWAITCSKPRVDEFGGGAFVVKRGYKTVWVDAASEALKQLEAKVKITEKKRRARRRAKRIRK